MSKQPAWAKLLKHRQQALQYPLHVLVWGPGNDGSLEYQKRCEIRDALRVGGHHAAFSEDLIPASKAKNDPIDEEILQADACDLIVVLYGSRGTQTEVDRLLSIERFAMKAILFVDEHILPKLKRTVAQGTWEMLMQRRGRVIGYTDNELRACAVVGQVTARATKLRFAAYVDNIRKSAGVP